MVKHTITFALAVASLIVSGTTQAYEPYIKLGANYHSGHYEIGIPAVDDNDTTGTGYHLGMGIRRSFGASNKHLIGAGIDVDKMVGQRIIGYRAIDYQYQFGAKVRSGLFVGAASLDSGLPQNGYYAGITASWIDVLAGADLTLELRQANGLARDRLQSSDPHPPLGRPDIFVDVSSTTLALSWRF